ncbi:MAG: NUDIX domain-containing protein [Acetobacteraceae bacterium]
MSTGGKTALQLRAEAAAVKFHTAARSAIVIEFAGVPKAGKTTTLSAVQAFLRRCGFRVNVVVERASVCPIKDKKDSNFNIWTSCTTLVQILDQTQNPPSVDDPEILILDRGMFDSIWWFTLMVELARIRRGDKELVEQFLLMDEWRKRISGVVVMLTDPNDALSRERGHLPVEGVQGSIMNPEVLGKTRDLVQATVRRLEDKFKFCVVDTSAPPYVNNQGATCEYVAGKILEWVEEQIEENIFSIEKSKVQDIFGARKFLTPEDTKRLEEGFLQSGSFKPRSVVEVDFGRVQALPIVVVRNHSGHILMLRRKEKRDDNNLHEKMVIWAGGHVRREDKEDSEGSEEGNPLTFCAVRELQEELRLRITPDHLCLLGSIYIDDAQNTSKHVAIVYEWRAETDSVAVSLNNAEFFERHGTSVSCNFVPKSSIRCGDQDGDLKEDWSKLIIEELLVK